MEVVAVETSTSCSTRIVASLKKRSTYLCLCLTFASVFTLFAMYEFDIDKITPANGLSDAIAVIKSFPWNWKKRRLAYVFYLTAPDYVCYALSNVHRLIYDLKADPNIDIVLLATEPSGIYQACPSLQCPFPKDRVKIKLVSNETLERSRSLTDFDYYKECYIRFEVLSLYDQYDRIVNFDADGVIMRNVDHLFEMDLENYTMAAALCYDAPYKWINSIFLVFDLSKSLRDEALTYLDRDQLVKVAAFHPWGHPHYDMDILNYMFKAGNLSKLLSKYYALFDHYFIVNDAYIREDELSSAYYIHFAHKKPLRNIEATRPWSLETDSSNLTMSHLKVPSPNGFIGKVYYPFWKNFDGYCRRWFNMSNLIYAKSG